ncbi:MAG: helix-turn-helix domain-containing protein [Pseudomonadota bacterium]
MDEKTPDRLFTREAAKYLRMSRSTLAKWRSSGEGPPSHSHGKRLKYYLRRDLDRWLTDNDNDR